MSSALFFSRTIQMNGASLIYAIQKKNNNKISDKKKKDEKVILKDSNNNILSCIEYYN